MRRVSFVAIHAVLAASLVACGEQEVVEEPILRPVRYQAVYSSGGERTRSFTGMSRAGQESRLSFKVAGTIDRIPVNVGDRISAGDVIAELDATDYRLQLQDGQASLARREAEFRQAKANYERIRQLYENRNASRADLDAARASSEAAEAGGESARKNLELARSRLRYCTLRAAVGGAISAVSVEVNENVGEGQVVAVLMSGSRPEVEITVPGVLIARVREGDSVTVTFDALPGRSFVGTVTEVGVSATGVGTTFPVKVQLDEENEEILSGMAAEVSFRFAATTTRERFLVPAASVQEDRGGRHTFVVEDAGDGTGTVQRRSVEVGELTEDGLEILEGLSDGDLVVTAGTSKIQDGMRVRVPRREAGS